MKNIQHFQLNISYFRFLREDKLNPKTEGKTDHTGRSVYKPLNITELFFGSLNKTKV